MVVIAVIFLGSLFGGNSGASWLSKIPKINENGGQLYGQGKTLAEIYPNDNTSNLSQAYPDDIADNFYGANDYNGIKYFRSPQTNGVYIGTVKGKANGYFCVYNGDRSSFYNYAGSVEKRPLILKVPNENFAIFAYKYKDCYELYFVYPRETCEDSVVRGYVLVSDVKYNDYLTGKLEAKPIKESELGKLKEDIEERKAEEKRLAAEQREADAKAVQEGFLSCVKVGQPLYCDKLDYSFVIKRYDISSMSIEYGNGELTDIYEINSYEQIAENTYSCSLTSNDTEGWGTFIISEGGIDVTDFYFPPEISCDVKNAEEQYVFSYADSSSKDYTSDNGSSMDDTSNGDFSEASLSVSDYWGSWYDINDTSIGIDIIGENDIPCVQISQTGTVWQFYCDYVNGELIYEDGECFKAGDNRDYLYKDGTGKFYIKDECLYWVDDIEGKGNGYKFEKLRPQDLLEMQFSGENSEYIYADSDSCVMTSADVDLAKSNFKGTLPSGKTIEQMIVNEIYARHGYRFKNDEIQSFFEGKSWYKNLGSYTDNMNDIELNDFESKNVKFLQN